MLELKFYRVLASQNPKTAITTEPEESHCLQRCGQKLPFFNFFNGIIMNHKLVME